MKGSSSLSAFYNQPIPIKGALPPSLPPQEEIEEDYYAFLYRYEDGSLGVILTLTNKENPFILRGWVDSSTSYRLVEANEPANVFVHFTFLDRDERVALGFPSCI